MSKPKRKTPNWLLKLFAFEIVFIVYYGIRPWLTEDPYRTFGLLRPLFLIWGAIMTARFMTQITKQQDGDTKVIWQAFAPVVFFSLVGARLVYISFLPPSSQLAGIFSPWDYWQNLTLLFSLRDGGLRVEGAVLGGVFGWLLFLRYHRLPVLKWSDRLSLVIFAAFVVAHWGIFYTNSPHGAPTTLPWGWAIPFESRLPEFADQTLFHPLFLYLSLWYTVAAAFPFYLWRAGIWKPKSGDHMVWFLASFVVGRLLIIPLQVNEPQITLLGIVSIPASVILLIPILLLALCWRHFAIRERNL